MKYIQSQTTGIMNLLMDDFLNIPIIILKDKDAQREIVDKYNEMQNKAKRLQEEAKELNEYLQKAHIITHIVKYYDTSIKL